MSFGTAKIKSLVIVRFLWLLFSSSYTMKKEVRIKDEDGRGVKREKG